AEVLERHRDVVARWPRNECPPERSISKAPRKGVAQHRASADEVELLKDHPDPATDPPQVGAARPGHIDAIEDDASARRFHEAIDRTKQRRFSRAREPDEDDELATLDLERHVVDGAGSARVDL